MCMITYLPAGIDVPYDGIANGATWNDDGHGWAVAAEPGVMLTGHYMDSGAALDTFDITRRAFPNAPALFHSRFATHGSRGLVNVHPFKVGKYSVVAHNGILPNKFHPQGTDSRSDTAILAGEWLQSQTQGMWTRKERKRIGRVIGDGNKLCILSVSPWLSEPKGVLVNANKGYWIDGAWFSNLDCTYDYRTSRYGKYSWDDDATVIGTKALGKWSDGFHGRTVPGECPFCESNSNVDISVNTCLKCDVCLDCLEMTRVCMCWSPESARKESESTQGKGWVME